MNILLRPPQRRRRWYFVLSIHLFLVVVWTLWAAFAFWEELSVFWLLVFTSVLFFTIMLMYLSRLLCDLTNKVERLELHLWKKSHHPESVVADEAPLLTVAAEMQFDPEHLISEFDQEKLDRLRYLVLAKLSDPDLKVEDFARELHVSRRQFFRDVKRLTGFTPRMYLQEMRLEHAYRMLESGRAVDLPSLIKSCGFTKVSYFREIFAKKYGKDPGVYFSVKH